MLDGSAQCTRTPRNHVSVAHTVRAGQSHIPGGRRPALLAGGGGGGGAGGAGAGCCPCCKPAGADRPGPRPSGCCCCCPRGPAPAGSWGGLAWGSSAGSPGPGITCTPMRSSQGRTASGSPGGSGSVGLHAPESSRGAAGELHAEGTSPAPGRACTVLHSPLPLPSLGNVGAAAAELPAGPSGPSAPSAPSHSSCEGRAWPPDGVSTLATPAALPPALELLALPEESRAPSSCRTVIRAGPPPVAGDGGSRQGMGVRGRAAGGPPAAEGGVHSAAVERASSLPGVLSSDSA